MNRPALNRQQRPDMVAYSRVILFEHLRDGPFSCSREAEPQFSGHIPSQSSCISVTAPVGPGLEPSVSPKNRIHIRKRRLVLQPMASRLEGASHISRESALQVQHIRHPLMMDTQRIDRILWVPIKLNQE